MDIAWGIKGLDGQIKSWAKRYVPRRVTKIPSRHGPGLTPLRVPHRTLKASDLGGGVSYLEWGREFEVSGIGMESCLSEPATLSYRGGNHPGPKPLWGAVLNLC